MQETFSSHGFEFVPIWRSAASGDGTRVCHSRWPDSFKPVPPAFDRSAAFGKRDN
jgi:hypothetical protein